ncbi:hypothetical protein T492DRAFT_892464 [Pavlovales sp. CCMP2436]|nr:hypothetical protein T492DRAFT_892464 [Pavlovales sp. CCMP2436]
MTSGKSEAPPESMRRGSATTAHALELSPFEESRLAAKFGTMILPPSPGSPLTRAHRQMREIKSKMSTMANRGAVDEVVDEASVMELDLVMSSVAPSGWAVSGLGGGLGGLGGWAACGAAGWAAGWAAADVAGAGLQESSAWTVQVLRLARLVIDEVRVLHDVARALASRGRLSAPPRPTGALLVVA